MTLSSKQIEDFQKRIINYYKAHGRNFPWRETADPYEIMVSEFMLQQTQTERVVPKYLGWLERFPTVKDLADADFMSVLTMWSGLGYNRRARFLHEAAKKIVSEYQGKVPANPQDLQKLPGIGSYTAAAISVFAYNNALALIETNIRSVFLFFFFPDKEKVHDTEIFKLITDVLYTENPRLWYYALMDYGAELKKRIKNPNRRSKHYTKQSKFEGSVRQMRGAILRSLQNFEKPAAKSELSATIDIELTHFETALSALIDEGFVAETDEGYCIKN
ncbi:A/G-specific adenine glycosylase [Treponema phagedenis]|uniref:Adenine DNA glycosylase n=2 Tax=Treponema phagedenis TaxID=162 RepID=A0A0B7GVT6_TREPH|nr:A/G-specific adenine glycosylase [Treponema phagedenis]NVP25245.1 A/G-specific adenine glycosylase [Treponema phagedenis]QEJ93900.1 A/G-specific adenine glycosylase [Treponema phagedenis]QEJ97082.1 A/G-specific adenine glycosylase [Treponema phagedenis]QEJ99827.1 A/G-specific adenine glycosylase [Treponema phagedenis]QEK02993.1 A/G-specific adenine glycosylase [Treponema phagedenis]